MTTKTTLLLSAAALTAALNQNAVAHGGHHDDGSHSDIKATILAEGLEHPWGMAFLPNGDLLVTERAGGIQRLSKDGKLSGRLPTCLR